MGLVRTHWRGGSNNVPTINVLNKYMNNLYFFLMKFLIIVFKAEIIPVLGIRDGHYENMPMQYLQIFSVAKIENFIRKFEAVLTSTHNLCFGAKIRKIGIPLHTPVFVYKSGVQGGKHYTDMLS